MLDSSRATLKLSLNGGKHHRRSVAIAVCVAMEKGYHIQDTTKWIGGGPVPDAVIFKDEKNPSGSRHGGGLTRYWLEVVDSHDPTYDWSDLGLSVTDVLILRVAGKTLDEVARLAEWVIP